MISKSSWFHTIVGHYTKRNRIAFNNSSIRIMPKLPKNEHKSNEPSSLEKALNHTNARAEYFRVLQGCADINGVSEVKLVHAHTIKTGFKPDILLFNCLLNKYAKCGDFEDARQLFDKMPERNVVSWNSMITGYVRCGDTETLNLFSKMLMAGLCPTQPTFVNLLVACAHMEALEYVKELYAHIVKFGFGADFCVQNALVGTYAKCGSIKDARQVFDKMPERDDISWKVMFAGYLRSGYAEEGLKLIKKMLREGARVGAFSFSSVLSACGCLEFSEQGKQFHAYVIKTSLDKDVSVGNALISMYAKSTNMEDAGLMFHELCSPDVVSWNTLIAGYAQNGYADIGLNVFIEMQLSGVKPNQSTIASFVMSLDNITCFGKARICPLWVWKGSFAPFQ